MKLLTDFLIISGIIVSILILWALFKTKKKGLPKKILTVFFVVLLLVGLHAYANLNEIPILYELTFIFDELCIWFIPPLLYVYIESIFKEHKGLLRKKAIHFLPVVSYFLIIAGPVLICVILEKPLFPYLAPIENFLDVIILIRDLYMVAYLLFSLRLFYSYQNAMKSNFSTLTESDFGWVKKMLLSCLIVIGIDLSTTIYETFIHPVSWNTGYATIVGMVVLIVYLGYYGVNQSSILLPDFLIGDTASKNTKSEKTNHLSNATDEELEMLKTRLETVLAEKKPYLDEELTLNKLAQLVPTTDKKLSTLLNQHMNTTFYDLINSYRVIVVKEKMSSKEFESLTLLGIAFESGFKSKTSFNRIFKKVTGLSPSEYKNTL